MLCVIISTVKQMSSIPKKKVVRWDRIFQDVAELTTVGTGTGMLVGVIANATAGGTITLASAFHSPFVSFFAAIGVALGFLRGYRKEKDVEEEA